MLDVMDGNVGLQNDQLPLKTVRGAGYTFTQSIRIQGAVPS
jgi:DNA-binding winged helix-turn-helix (wHTH) protein